MQTTELSSRKHAIILLKDRVNFLLVISQQGRSKPLSPEEAADLCRMQCLTVAFLLHMPLSQRSQLRILKSCWTNQVLPLIKMVCVALSYFPCHRVQLTFWFPVFLYMLLQSTHEIKECYIPAGNKPYLVQ